VRALLQCDVGQGTAVWDQAWLSATIAGLPLLQRHLLAFRQAGVREVTLTGCHDTASIGALIERLAVPGVSVRFGPAPAEPFLEQRADTLVDPRLLLRLMERFGTASRAVECVDETADNQPVDAKSPYVVGTPDEGDLRDVEAAGGAHHVVGLAVRWSGSPPRRLHVGRHYWHRVWTPADLRCATRKVFLGTMKPTDGMYARTNRRVSIPISTWLARTPISANAVTIATLGVSALAGWLFSLGGYSSTVVASLTSWFASMLDGVDGELARAKFQASETGRWLEMVSDYLYYVFVFGGMAVGAYRDGHNAVWLAIGAAASVGVVLSFVAVARWNYQYLQLGQGRDPGFAFQRTVGSQPGNRVYAFLRKMTVLATRAALPYYIVVFALSGTTRIVLALACLGTNLVWPLVLLVKRPLARRRHAASPAAEPRSRPATSRVA
jgi:phosphatidylglycerophosphate synthase